MIKNKIVFITGASSGIGLATAKRFAQNGAKLILASRRVQKLETLAAALKKEHNALIHILPLDVRQKTDVSQKIKSLSQEWAPIDVLVNNAGLASGLDRLQEGNIQDWEDMIDTNIKGLLYVTRAILPGMVERKRGHIINIGSVAGHQVYPRGNVYCATKHAVRALSEGMRMDMLGTPIRVSSVDPGAVETEFSMVRFKGNKQRAQEVYQGMTPLRPEDIADVIAYCVGCPSHVNISEVIIMPTCQASATLFHRDEGL